MTITLFGGLTLPKKIKRLFKKPGIEPHLYVFGANGQPVQGFQPGNYFDSAGTALASVDGSVGLVLDAAGSVGADVIVNGGFNSAVSWDTPSNAWVIADGKASTTVSVININQLLPIALQYKMIQVEFDLVVVSGSVRAEFGGANGATAIATGKYSTIIKAINADRFLYIYGVTPFTGSIDNVVVREVTGIHASQSTPGYKPTLRKGIVNLLTYSNDLTNAAWVKSGVTISGSDFVETTGVGARYVQGAAPNTVAGNSYTTAVIAKSGGGRHLQIPFGAPFVSSSYANFDLSSGVVSGKSASVQASISDLGSGLYLCVASATASTSSPDNSYAWVCANPATDGYAVSVTGLGATSLKVAAIGRFQGTLTAAQILAAGGIPLTTNAPASSQAGVNHLEFKAANSTVLQLPSPAFQMADDHCVVVAATYAGGTVTNSVIYSPAADSTGGSIKRIGQISYDATLSRIQGSWYDGTNYDELYFAWPSGSPFVAATRKVGSTLELWVNGVLRVTKTATATAFTANCGSIGGYPTSGAACYFNGVLHYADAIKGTVSNADLILQCKLAASQAGIQL